MDVSFFDVPCLDGLKSFGFETNPHVHGYVLVLFFTDADPMHGWLLFWHSEQNTRGAGGLGGGLEEGAYQRKGEVTSRMASTKT